MGSQGFVRVAQWFSSARLLSERSQVQSLPRTFSIFLRIWNNLCSIVFIVIHTVITNNILKKLKIFTCASS
jgi:hypothetical protein